MARSAEPPSPLVLAAQELEDELRRCEKDVEEAARLRLNSERNVGRAAQALHAASEGRERIAGKLNALLAALNAAHDRMEEVATHMQSRALELQGRLARLEALRASTAEIAVSVREVNEVAKGAKDPRDLLDRLDPIDARVARAFEEARAEEFEDVARDIAGMRDMLAAMRRKLKSL